MILIDTTCSLFYSFRVSVYFSIDMIINCNETPPTGQDENQIQQEYQPIQQRQPPPPKVKMRMIQFTKHLESVPLAYVSLLHQKVKVKIKEDDSFQQAHSSLPPLTSTLLYMLNFIVDDVDICRYRIDILLMLIFFVKKVFKQCQRFNLEPGSYRRRTVKN